VFFLPLFCFDDFEVRPPKGRTPGDLRAMLVTLKPLLAQVGK
jgi:hypothetical protein